MSVEQYIFLNAGQLPSAPEVTVRAQAIGYDFVIVQPVDLATHRGYLPIAFEGKTTGFEAYFMSVNEMDCLPSEATQRWTHFVMTVTGGDPLEALSATIYLKTLSELSGGAYWYTDEPVKEPEDVSVYLDEVISSFKAMIEKKAYTLQQTNTRPTPEPHPSQPPKGGFFSKLLGRN